MAAADEDLPEGIEALKAALIAERASASTRRPERRGSRRN